MQIAPVRGFRRADWDVDGELAASPADTYYPWPVRHGTHSVKALVWTDAVAVAGAQATDDIRFYVHPCRPIYPTILNGSCRRIPLQLRVGMDAAQSMMGPAIRTARQSNWRAPCKIHLFQTAKLRS